MIVCLEQQTLNIVNETFFSKCQRLWRYGQPKIQRACYVPYQRLDGGSELWYRASVVSELASAIDALCSVMQHGLIFV